MVGLPAERKAQTAPFGAEKEGKMPSNYGFEPMRPPGKRQDQRKDFQAGRKKKLRVLEKKSRQAREQLKRIGLEEI